MLHVLVQFDVSIQYMSTVPTGLPGIPAQIHYLSPYAWPSRALRSEICAPADMAEMQTLQRLGSTVGTLYSRVTCTCTSASEGILR